MKKIPANPATATLALICSAVLGGVAPIAAKFALREITPMTLLFVRIVLTVGIMMPFAWRHQHSIFQSRKQLVLLGLLYAVNVSLFIVGVGYTTAAMSQMLYALVPIFILIENVFITKELLRPYQVVGIALGLIGVLFILFEPSKAGSFGTIYGNALITIGAISWSLYTLFSKKISERVSPSSLTFVSAGVTLPITIALMGVQEGAVGILELSSVSMLGIFSTLVYSIGVGVFLVFLYQWGIKHGSVIVAGANPFISTFTAAVLGVLILGESLTVNFIIGGSVILIGVFLTSMLPLLKKKIR